MNDDRSASTRGEPTVRFEERDAVLTVILGGTWSLRSRRPDPAPVVKALGSAGVEKVVLTTEQLKRWDSSLLLHAMEIRSRARDRDLPCDLSGFPGPIAEWLEAADPAGDEEREDSSGDYYFPITRKIGLTTQSLWYRAVDMTHFLGESALSIGRIFGRPDDFHWSNAVLQMQRCGAQALGIVGLISFLVGVILAFVAAMQLRQFGADVFVANLVGLAVFREMGPMMAAIVLAGRTGAAYAAELGNMRLNEEIDALETFGINPFNFLVAPRMVALVLMMPLLTIYANVLGITGGAVISQTVLDVPPQTFVQQLRGAVGLTDIGTGLLKSFFFGMIIAYSGCLKGMNADRSAVGVGEATTAAVVLSILLIIIADAIFTVLFNALNW